MKSRASRELGGLDRTCPAPAEGEPRTEDCCHKKVASVARISNSSRAVDSLGFYVNAPFFFFHVNTFMSSESKILLHSLKMMCLWDKSGP